MSDRGKKITSGLACISTGLLVWIGASLRRRLNATLLVIGILCGLLEGCHANASPVTNTPENVSITKKINSVFDFSQFHRMLDTMSTTNKTFRLAKEYIVAEMAGKTPPNLPSGITRTDLSNAAFQMFILPQVAMRQQVIEFCGKIVDGSNQPVKNASIELTWTHVFPPPEGKFSTNVTSDTKGLFYLSGVVGLSLDVRIKKEGFSEVENLNTNRFNYSTLPETVLLHADSNNPVIFHLQTHHGI